MTISRKIFCPERSEASTAQENFAAKPSTQKPSNGSNTSPLVAILAVFTKIIAVRSFPNWEISKG